MNFVKRAPTEEPFIWRDEETDKFHIVESCDVFDKPSSELGRHGKGHRQLLHWFCCKCDTGPMALEDADTFALFESESSCAGKDCSHLKCENCILAEGTEEENGNISWNGTISSIYGKQDVNGLALSEGKLFKDIPMKDDTPFGYCGEVLQLKIPGYSTTPGLTISSARNPESDHEIPDQQYTGSKFLAESKIRADSQITRHLAQKTRQGFDEQRQDIHQAP